MSALIIASVSKNPLNGFRNVYTENMHQSNGTRFQHYERQTADLVRGTIINSHSSWSHYRRTPN
jgi:hypothetical protein